MTIVNKELHRFDEHTALFLESLPRQGVARFSLETADSQMLTPLCQEVSLEKLQNIPLISAVFLQLERKHDIALPPKLKNKIQKQLVEELNKVENAITKSIEEVSDTKKDKDKLDRYTLKEEEENILVFKVARHIASHTKFITFRDNENCYYYDEGYYKGPQGEIVIKEKARELLGELATRKIVKEIVDTIKDTTHIDRNTPDPNLLCLENGILDIEANPPKLSPHTPDHIFFSKMPITYLPDADCPRIKKFFREVLYAEDITVMEEVIGYCIYPKHSFHKAVMMIGSGRNGKGTLLRLIEAFLGSENCESETLYMLNADKYSSAKLHGKLANLCGDISPKGVKYTGIFKKLTGEDKVSAQRKYEKKFRFLNHAKLIFACNKPPEVDDDTLAFWERWIYFLFPNVFIGKAADKQLDDKLQTPEELSGLLNLALKGLKRLLKQNDFSYGKSSKEIQEEWIRSADSVGAFVFDMIEFDLESDPIKKRDLYDNYYLPYCNEMEYPTDSIVSYEKFGEKLKLRCMGRIKHTHPRSGDKRFTAWKGIKIKDSIGKKKEADKIKDEKQQKLQVKEKKPTDDEIQEELKLEGLTKDIWKQIGEDGVIKEFMITRLKMMDYDVLAIERTLKLMIERGLVKFDKEHKNLTRARKWK